MKRRSSVRHRRQAGFTLVEMIVSLVVLVQVILVALLLFQFNARVTHTQTRLAEMQQSLRVGQNEMVRMLRMAGRGGLPITGATGPVAAPTTPPFRLAFDVANNVTGGAREVAPNFTGTSPEALEGTDILIVRGNFSAPQYYGTGMVLNDDPVDATAGTLIINRVTPQIPVQDLADINEAIDNEVPEALILFSGSPGDRYVVVELNPASSISDEDTVTIAFNIKGNTRANSYRELWTNDNAERFPIIDGSDLYLAILEEYRFYVRNESASLTPLDVRPRLSRARLMPNTGVPHGNPANLATSGPLTLATDLADDIVDLQVAVAMDTPNTAPAPGGDGIDRMMFESDDGADDDWLFNSPDDDPTADLWNDTNPENVPPVFYLRLSTLARTAGRDLEYEGPVLDGLEDHSYQGNDLINSEIGRKYRFRSLQTIVKLRNEG